MSRIKSFINWKSISVVVFVLIFLISNVVLNIVLSVERDRLTEQNIATKWFRETPAMQTSVFFTMDSQVDMEAIKQFEYIIDKKLKEASSDIVSQDSTREWADSYSAENTGIVTYGKRSERLTIVGVGGDYFLFHPIPLIEGAYFANYNSDLEHDYCILDMEAAWKLFGSSDVVGKVVELNGALFFITGVVETPDGDIYKEAGFNPGRIYISIERQQELFKHEKMYINEYGIVLPEPVDGYAKNMIIDNMTVNSEQMVVIENTGRFAKKNILKHIGSLPNRAVVNKPFVYPYWENIARIQEDYLAKVCIGVIIFLICSGVIIPFVVRRITLAAPH